jgi:4-carboxymuconolactone decarboxylase
MKSIQILIGLLLLVGTSVVAGHELSSAPQQTTSGQGVKSSVASAGALPKDLYPDSGNRLPPIKREDLDEAGKKFFDSNGPSGPFGPMEIRLYNPTVANYAADVNDYLRHKAGLDPRYVELTILVTSREFDSEYVWTAHEPRAQKAGVEQEIIDTVKYRKPLTGIGEKEAAIIQLGRESLGKHKVSSDTFARALKAFGNQGLVNIVSLMSDYAGHAIITTAFDQQVRPGAKPLLPIP